MTSVGEIKYVSADKEGKGVMWIVIGIIAVIIIIYLMLRKTVSDIIPSIPTVSSVTSSISEGIKSITNPITSALTGASNNVPEVAANASITNPLLIPVAFGAYVGEEISEDIYNAVRTPSGALVPTWTGKYRVQDVVAYQGVQYSVFAIDANTKLYTLVNGNSRTVAKESDMMLWQDYMRPADTPTSWLGGADPFINIPRF